MVAFNVSGIITTIISHLIGRIRALVRLFQAFLREATTFCDVSQRSTRLVLIDVPPVKFIWFFNHSLFPGITWVFGFLAVEEASLVFQYLFCIFNALQGFLIFIFHHVREPSVRKAWMALCCKGTNILRLQTVNLCYSFILYQFFSVQRKGHCE